MFFFYALFSSRSNVRDILHDFPYKLKQMIKLWQYEGDGRFPSFISITQTHARHLWVRWARQHKGVHYLWCKIAFCCHSKIPRPKANSGEKSLWHLFMTSWRLKSIIEGSLGRSPRQGQRGDHGRTEPLACLVTEPRITCAGTAPPTVALVLCNNH